MSDKFSPKPLFRKSTIEDEAFIMINKANTMDEFLMAVETITPMTAADARTLFEDAKKSGIYTTFLEFCKSKLIRYVTAYNMRGGKPGDNFDNMAMRAIQNPETSEIKDELLGFKPVSGSEYELSKDAQGNRIIRQTK
jgi:hypothetical protein